MLQRLIVLEVLPRIGEMLGIVDPSDRLGRRCYFLVDADIGGGELQRLQRLRLIAGVSTGYRLCEHLPFFTRC